MYSGSIETLLNIDLKRNRSCMDVYCVYKYDYENFGLQNIYIDNWSFSFR